MKRRFNMALPLIFAFVLTLMPFILLEYNQHQRNKIQHEREVTRWEQAAGNYLQLFRSLWSLEAQINRRFFLLYKNLSRYQKDEHISADNFMLEMRSCFPQKFMPKHIFAGAVNKNDRGVAMFNGDGYTRLKQRFFKRILDGLSKPENSYSSSELAGLNATVRGAFGEIVDFELLRNYRSGKISAAVYEGQHVFVIWDSVTMASGQRVVYLMLFAPDTIDRVGSMQLASNVLGEKYSTVSSVLLPLSQANTSVKPVFDRFLKAGQRNTILQCLSELKENQTDRDRLFPPGKFVDYRGLRIMREFIDYAVPYEIWITSRGAVASEQKEPFVSFALRLFFYTAWILVFAKVLISGNPVGISLQAWLTLTFMVVGVLPLLVFYVAGLFHVDSSAYRQEQEAIKDGLQQLEEADASGEVLLANYHNFCQHIENDPEWVTKMADWNSKSWDTAVEALPAKFAAAGLSVDAVYVYPPDIASISGQFYQLAGSDYSEKREKDLFNFYFDWIRKGYFSLSPTSMTGEDPELQMFKGRSGKEVMRYFLSNRGDIEFVDFSHEKYFVYQNFLIHDGQIRNWYFLRISIARAFEQYLRESVFNLQALYSDNIYAIAEIKGSRSTLVFPSADGKDANMVTRTAGHLIELAGVTRTSIIEQNDDHLLVVYPCVRSGPFILANLVFFKNFRLRALRQEMILSFIVALMAIPVFMISRLTAQYLVRPLLDVESGLTKISAEDFSQKLQLQREDELGQLSLAFDKMVEGIKERRNLGRFVSASLDQQVAIDEKAGQKGMTGRFGAILCSDIRSFTMLSESYPVRDIVAMLNEHLAAMSSCVKEYDGMVEQFVGDAIIAIFYGESLAEASDRAVKAALAMIKRHRQINEQRRLAGCFDYAFGIGIEVGYLLSGTVKAGDRYEYVVVGDARVRSEELEGLSKKGRHTRVMVSEKVYDLTRGLYEYEMVENGEFELVRDKGNSENDA